MAAEQKLTLNEPLELRSKETGAVVSSISELTLRPLRMGDLVAAMDAAGGQRDVGTLVLHLAARSCGLTPGQLADLALEDGFRVMEIVQGFIPAGLRTGTASST